MTRFPPEPNLEFAEALVEKQADKKLRGRLTLLRRRGESPGRRGVVLGTPKPFWYI